MHVFSLGFPTTVQLYLNSDELTRKNFSKACRYFHYVAQCADGASYIHQFISANYEFLKESSSVKEFTVATVFRWNAIIISEFHCSAYHRMINSQLVNMLWRPNTDLYLETEDDGQIPQALQLIKSQIKCWDLEKEKNSLNVFDFVFHSICESCLSYLDNFHDDEFNFMGFLEAYRFNKKLLINLTKDSEIGIEDFHFLDEIEEICTEASTESDPRQCKRHLIDITNLILQECQKVAISFRKKLDSLDELRNMSLTLNAWVSLSKNKIPLIVAGHAHVTSAKVQKFSKEKGIVCVALRPHNKIRNNKPVDRVTDIRNALDAETNEWFEANFICKKFAEINYDPQKMEDFILTHEQLFAAVKMKMSRYKFEPEVMAFWIAIPVLVYMKKLFDLEREVAQKSKTTA